MYPRTTCGGPYPAWVVAGPFAPPLAKYRGYPCIRCRDCAGAEAERLWPAALRPSGDPHIECPGDFPPKGLDLAVRRVPIRRSQWQPFGCLASCCWPGATERKRSSIIGWTSPRSWRIGIDCGPKADVAKPERRDPKVGRMMGAIVAAGRTALVLQTRRPEEGHRRRRADVLPSSSISIKFE